MTAHVPPLINLDHVPGADEIFHARGVPIGQTNATVAGGAPDRLRIVCSVNADARFVESAPENADEIIWSGRKVVILLGSDAVVEHPFVVAKPGPDGHAENFPGPLRRGQSCRSWRNRKLRDELCAIVDFKKPLSRVDENLAIRECRVGFDKSFAAQLLSLKRQDIWNVDHIARFEAVELLARIQFAKISLRRMVTFGHKFEQRS